MLPVEMIGREQQCRPHGLSDLCRYLGTPSFDPIDCHCIPSDALNSAKADGCHPMLPPRYAPASFWPAAICVACTLRVSSHPPLEPTPSCRGVNPGMRHEVKVTPPLAAGGEVVVDPLGTRARRATQGCDPSVDSAALAGGFGRLILTILAQLR